MVAHGERSAAATAPCRVHPRTWRGEIREPDRAGQLRSDRTNCRKDGQPSRVQAAKNQASWYCLSWRGLQSGASTPDDSRLNTPETTPPSIPTNLATAPGEIHGSLLPDQPMAGAPTGGAHVACNFDC